MASDVSQNMPEAPSVGLADNKAGEGGVEALLHDLPKGLTAHQPHQLSDAKWLVEEGKQCSFWIDVPYPQQMGSFLLQKICKVLTSPTYDGGYQRDQRSSQDMPLWTWTSPPR